jgi:hypothetical protein
VFSPYHLHWEWQCSKFRVQGFNHVQYLALKLVHVFHDQLMDILLMTLDAASLGDAFTKACHIEWSVGSTYSARDQKIL